MVVALHETRVGAVALAGLPVDRNDAHSLRTRAGGARKAADVSLDRRA